MAQSLPPAWRRLLHSLAYGALVIVVIGLGYWTFRVSYERRHAGSQAGPATAESMTTPLIEVSSFSARHEKSSDAERLTISMRLRLTAPGNIDCRVYVLARNDHVAPRLWGVWPPQGAGDVTASGNLRGGNPVDGEPLPLTSSWTRITATVNHPFGRPAFETATLYVVNLKGEILLARPFVL
jgi:hypothetical protein